MLKTPAPAGRVKFRERYDRVLFLVCVLFLFSTSLFAQPFDGEQKTRTYLTRDIQVDCTATGDTYDNNQISLSYQGNNTLWAANVSSQYPTAVLGRDIRIGNITVKAGLKVTYTVQTDGMYTLTLTGKVVVNGEEYDLAGLSLGTFKSHFPPKS